MKIVNGLAIIIAILLPMQLKAVGVHVSFEDCSESPSYQALSDKYVQQMQAAKLVRDHALYLQAQNNYATAQAHADACLQLQQSAALSTSTRTQ